MIFVKCSAETPRQWVLSTKDRRKNNNKTNRTYRKCRSHASAPHCISSMLQSFAHTEPFEPPKPMTVFLTQRPPVILTPTLIWQMEPCAVTSWSRQPLSMKDTLGRAKTNWGAAMTHSGFHVRKLAVRLANSLSEVRKEEEGLGRSKTHLIGPIRALASLLHPQFFYLSPL